MSGYAPDETCDAYSERIINRARKEHKCTACRCVIRKGDRYSYTSLVYDGGVQVIKRCIGCEYIYRALCNDLAAGRITDADLIEPRLDCGHRYEDTHGEPMPDHLARIAFMTPDELQKLDFSEIERERYRLMLQRELASSRQYETSLRSPDYHWRWNPARLESAARQNARTCELERRLELLEAAE